MSSGLEQRLAFLDDAGQRPTSLALSDSSVRSDRWDINNSSFYDYCNPYHQVGTGCNKLAELICERLIPLNGGAAIDLAGGQDGLALQELMFAGLVTRGLVTNLKDKRSYEVPGLDHIKGNLLRKTTWKKIVEWVETEAPSPGLSLIMHRPVGPLQGLKPETYEKATHFLLDMLRPGGILLCQVPLSLLVYKDQLQRIEAGITGRPDISEIVTDMGIFYPRPAAIFKRS